MDDVIIIGAGPAGANTALGLVSEGRAVSVIDCKEIPGDKLCTGIIGSECVDKYPPDEGLILCEPTSAVVTASNYNQYTFSTKYPQASVVDRVKYISRFSEKAAALGAKYYLGERVLSIDVWDDYVEVCTTARTLTSKAVVIASGFGTSLLNCVGIQKGREYIVGSQAEVEVYDLDRVQIFLDSARTPGFFSWITPTASGRGLVGVLADSKTKPKLTKLLEYLQDQGDIGQICNSSRSWGIPLKPIELTHGDRVLVVGDAAGQIKPITGGGIYYSLLCGDIAASVLNKCLDSGNLTSDALSEYETLWKAEIGKEIHTSYVIRKFVEKIPRKIQTQLVKVAKVNSVIEDLIINKGMFDNHSQIFATLFSHSAISWIFRSNYKSSVDLRPDEVGIQGFEKFETNEENEVVTQ